MLYIDTVDKRTFLYATDNVYETILKLHELEGQLEDSDFFRASFLLKYIIELLGINTIIYLRIIRKDEKINMIN